MAGSRSPMRANGSRSARSGRVETDAVAEAVIEAFMGLILSLSWRAYLGPRGAGQVRFLYQRSSESELAEALPMCFDAAMAESGYKQFCPVAKGAEIVATRWTPLILRELMCGERSFNDIHLGVPLMSRALLSERLRQL